ncbi:MAG TPA: class D sortase [Bryobacteraceae bacterium]|nr:class D sortase [Bryobacteraceae bacterium]
MTNTDDPVLVRRDIRLVTSPSLGPGLHSHNGQRHDTAASSSRFSLVRILQYFLLFAGLCGTGYYAYTLSDQYIYQKYENWAFDQQIGGRTGVTFTDYLREKTPVGFLAGSKSAAVGPQPPPPARARLVRPVTGALLGRVTISRLGLAAIVREGVDAGTLSSAVGHVPSTALPGESGNFAIAAHRDTLFRALKDIRKDDVISFESPQSTYRYQVEATKIVRPSDVSVLKPDGGGLMDMRAGSPNSGRLLTMITCYPFYYVGAAPKRFIVEARMVSESAINQNDSQEAKAKAAVPLAAKPRDITSKRARKKHAIPRRFWHR